MLKHAFLQPSNGKFPYLYCRHLHRLLMYHSFLFFTITYKNELSYDVIGRMPIEQMENKLKVLSVICRQKDKYSPSTVIEYFTVLLTTAAVC